MLWKLLCMWIKKSPTSCCIHEDVNTEKIGVWATVSINIHEDDRKIN